jgi:hypothetical protein
VPRRCGPYFHRHGNLENNKLLTAYAVGPFISDLKGSFSADLVKIEDGFRVRKRKNFPSMGK